MTLQEAIEEVKRDQNEWGPWDLAVDNGALCLAIATILNAVVKEELREHDATLIALAPYLARRVLAAEKLVEDLDEVLRQEDDHWASMRAALTAYREASK